MEVLIASDGFLKLKIGPRGKDVSILAVDYYCSKVRKIGT